MSAAGDKQIKFTFAVDQRSVEVARGAIRQLTSEIKTLVETMTRAGQGMQGLGGGRGLFGGISNTAGGVNPSREASMKGGSVLTSGITADARALSASAKAGADAMRQMTTSVKGGLTDQISKIQQLRKELSDLDRDFKKMGGGINWGSNGGGMAAERMSNRQDAREAYNRMAEAEIAAARQVASQNVSGGFVGPGQRIVNKGGIDTVVGGGQSLWERMNTPLFGSGKGGMGERMLQSFGMNPNSMRGIGGVAAFVKGWDAMTGGMNNVASANNAQLLADPMQRLNRAAAFGQTFGGTAMAIRGGSISSGWAMKRALENSGMMDVLRDTTLRTQQAHLGTGYDVGTFKGLYSQGKQGLFGFGRYLIDHPGALNPFSSGDGGTTNDERGRKYDAGLSPEYKSKEAIAYTNAMRDMSSQKAQELAQAQRAILAADPRFAATLDRTYGEAGMRVGLGRMGGYSGGIDPRTRLDRMDVLDARLAAQGYNLSEYMSARRNLGGTAGWGYRGALGTQAISMGYGGFSGAEGLFGMGAQFGGGAGGGHAMINAIQSSIGGGGGMDVTAGSNMFGGLMQSAMGSGNFGFGMNPQVAMQALAAMGATGETGGDMRMARILQGGMGSWGNRLSGGIDPLQQALNVSAANVGMGGAEWGAKSAVMGLGPTEMLSILRGGPGNMPSYLTDVGASYGDVSGYHRAQQNTMFARNWQGQFGEGTAAAGALSGIQGAGGDWVSYIKGRMGTKGHGSLESELSPLASVLKAGQGGSAETNMGDLMAQLAGDESFAPFLKAGGAHAAGRAARDIASQGAEGEMKMSDAKYIAGKLGDLINEIKASPARYTGYDAAGKAGAAAASDLNGFDKSLKTLTASIDNYTKAIDGAAAQVKAGPKRK